MMRIPCVRYLQWRKVNCEALFTMTTLTHEFIRVTD